jgi:hypothetical protein
MRRIVLLAFAIALAACGTRPELTIERARVSTGDTPALEAELKLALGPTLEEALARGIPLTLRLQLSAHTASDVRRSERHLVLRYLPLAQRWQLLDREQASARSFARRTQLLAALDRVRLPLDPAWREAARAYTLEIALDRDALPGTLRLPALVAPAWRLSAPSYRWIAAS